MPRYLELSAAPDTAVLQAALNAVAARHEVLRMRFVQRADGTVQGLVASPADFSVPLRVVSAPSDKQEAAILQAEAATPFDLSSQPLLRCTVVVRSGAGGTGGTGATLAMVMHHAVGDAWTRGIFEAEVVQAYAATLAGKEPAWDPLPIQYADWAAWSKEQLAGEAGDELRQWWRQALVGAPPLLQLPMDRPRPAEPTFAAGLVQADLPALLLGRLDDLAVQLRVNTQAVLLAAFQAVLLRYSGQDEVVVAVPVAGRDRPEAQGLVGYFINTLPVRAVAAGGASWADMAQAASRATLEALAHGALPVDQILAAAQVQRIPGVNPLFQVSGCPVKRRRLSPWPGFIRTAGAVLRGLSSPKSVCSCPCIC